MRNERYEKITNEDLVDRIGDGDKRAFEALLHRHQSAILNFIFRFTGNRADAEDLTQEVFLSVWRAAKTYRPDAKFTTWLYRIARNRCINKQRANRIRRLFTRSDQHAKPVNPGDSFLTGKGGDRLTPEDRLIYLEQTGQLLNAINALPTHQRIAIILKIYDEMSYQEIAHIMDRSISAVDSLLIRAKRNLRKNLMNTSKLIIKK
jgi:RNA polymerase sigma-70 factor (ECF subfamily)